MKFHTLSLGLALNAAVSSALKIPIRHAKRAVMQRRSGASGTGYTGLNAFTANDYQDIIYIGNITIGGHIYPVQLDTGSSDLWVKGSSSPIPNSNPTSQTYNLSYGIGWAHGTISHASVEFAGIPVSDQAFLDSNIANNPALVYGASGICGIGFDSLSTIDALTNGSTGKTLLYNMFLENKTVPNYISMSLQRDSDQSDTADGVFAVGEVDSRYQSILNTSPIPTFPVISPNRWNVLVDSIVVGSKQVSLTTSVADAPSTKAVALLDTGTSYSYAPPEVCKAIYGSVQGARLDSNLGQWIVPCDVEIDVALQINNQLYPLHPLDVSPTSITDPSTCVGSFIPQDLSIGSTEFDWILGDSVLRAVYTLYDYGDFDASGSMGNPYVKLLSLVDPNEASQDFHDQRGGTPNNVTYNAANSTDSSTTVSLSDDVQQVLDKIGNFFPAMLAVMAFNALILLVLVIVGIVILCKRRKPKIARKTRGRMSPLPLNRTSRFGTESTHTYEPVSMAMSEDTFVPPMPAFRGDTSRSKTSRKSSLSTISPASPTSATSSVPPEDPQFTSPGIPFPTLNREVRPGDRPMSSFVPSPARRQSFMPPERPQSSYVPSPNSPHSPRLPAAFTNELRSGSRPSRPSFASSVQESPFEQPVTSISEEQPGDHDHRPPTPSAVSPDRSLFIPPSAAFNSNIQPGDRPRSYVPSAVSPEDELFAPPSPAFRSADRPRSMA